MTLKVRNLPHEKLEALISVANQQSRALGAYGALPHYAPNLGADGEPEDLVTAPDASNLATSQELARDLALALEAHGADTEAHSSADTIAIAAWTSRPDVPVNLDEVEAVLNEVKTDFNTHIANATPHRAVGAAGRLAAAAAIATADATDQGTANTLANVLKGALNAHAAAGAQDIEVIPS